MTTTFVDVDVRPILRAGGEPFEKIMDAVTSLKPGEGLRLFATFKPVPLLHVLGSRGFTHVANELEGGEWEVLFSPSGAPPTHAASVAAGAVDDFELARARAASRQSRSRSARAHGKDSRRRPNP